MDYAVVLYLDQESENNIQSLINKVAENGVNNYMIETRIPPHITIGAFQYNECFQELIDVIEKKIDQFSSGEVYWASIGIFNPKVIFLAPVLNKYLQCACEQINNELKTIAGIGDGGNYLPFQWVPHTAVATRLNDAELISAFEVVYKEFHAFGGVANRLALAKCNPYKEIKIWDLI